MLQGLRHWLQRCDRALPLTVYSKDPDDTQRRHGVRVLDNRYAPRRRVQLQQWLSHSAALLQHRHFILGGGDLLRDAPERDVAGEWLQPLERANAARRRTLVLGISVGKIWRDTTQTRIQNTLNHVNLIAVRDQASREKLMALGVTNPIYVMSDLALETVSFLPQSPQTPHHPTIGISIRAVAGRSANQTNQTFYQRLASIIDQLIEDHNANIWLLPFQAYPDDFRRQYSPPVDDEVAIAQVSQLSCYPERLKQYKRFSNLEELITCLSNLDLMVGTRLHSIILAAGLGIPVIAIEYAPKIRGFMAEIQQLDYCLALDSLTPQQSVALIAKILNNWLAIRQQLCQAVESYRARMDEIDLALQTVLSP